jgi:hypothetical protein
MKRAISWRGVLQGDQLIKSLDIWRGGPLTTPQQFNGLGEWTRSPTIIRDRNILPYQFRFIEISKAGPTDIGICCSFLICDETKVKVKKLIH